MKKQGALALLLGAPKGEEGDAGGDFHDAARDALDAIKDDDAASFAAALKRAIHACEDEYAEDDDASEDEG